MKNLLVAMLVFALSGSAIANVTYTETLELYTVETGRFRQFWIHNNPAEATGGGLMTPEEYEQAVLAGDVLNASLTIVLDSLHQNDSVMALVRRDQYDAWHDLGLLETTSISDNQGLINGPDAHPGHKTSTTFDIEPAWLVGGLQIRTQVVIDPVSNPIEIETSTLSVTTMSQPAPSAILLGGIGVILVGWLRRGRAL